MKIFDSFRSALQSIIVNKLRSALTMLGVIIGVASVIAMVAVGNGVSQSVQQQVLSLGSNLVTVTPGAQKSDTGLNGRRQYRLTPASLTAARDSGFTLRGLDDWFVQRTGQPLSAAGRLLLTGGMMPAPEFRRQLVLHVPTPEIADGLVQWPATRGLIQSRFGPTALAVAEEHAEALRQVLRSLGVNFPDRS